MDSLPKSRYGRFIHPGLLPDESPDIAAPAKIHEGCTLSHETRGIYLVLLLTKIGEKLGKGSIDGSGQALDSPRRTVTPSRRSSMTSTPIPGLAGTAKVESGASTNSGSTMSCL